MGIDEQHECPHLDGQKLHHAPCQGHTDMRGHTDVARAGQAREGGTTAHSRAPWWIWGVVCIELLAVLCCSPSAAVVADADAVAGMKPHVGLVAQRRGNQRFGMGGEDGAGQLKSHQERLAI
jgi:hypothetical protein